MNDAYLFRLYASPWKLTFFLIASVAFVAIAYQIGFRPGAHPDGFNLLMAWLTLILFGLAGVVFGLQLVFQVIARQPLVEFTAEGVRYRIFPALWKETRIPWSAIARIGVYRQATGRASMSYLTLFPRSRELDMALAQRIPSEALSSLRGLHVMRIPLSAAFLRVTPARCERLLADIQTACASEIAQYNVYVEPKVQRML